MAEIGPSAGAFWEARMNLLRALASCTRKLDEAASGSNKGVMKAPAFTAVVVVLLRWPDALLPVKLALGFEVVGLLEPCGIHREMEDSCVIYQPLQLEGDWAKSLVDDDLEHDVRIHPHAEHILAATVEEQQLGLASEFFTRHQLDDRYEVGMWCPLPRHIIEQGGKKRPIDDGRRSGHNRAATETFVTQSPEVVPLAAKLLVSLAVRR